MSLITTASAGLTALVALMDAIKKKTAISLTQYTKPANIMSQVYMQDSVAYDEIALPLLGSLNQLYASYVMTAINMNTVVINGRTVKEIYGIIATEMLGEYAEIVGVDFGCNEVDANWMDKQVISMEAGTVELEKDSQRLITGRMIELDLSVEGDDGRNGTKVNKYTIYIYVQLIPRLLPETVARGVLSVNFTPPISIRWKQVRAGEISFIKDFLGSRDLLAKTEKALKEDKTGMLGDMLLSQHNAIANALTRVLTKQAVSSNLANSIIVLEKDTFMSACRECGVDMDRTAQRTTFFMKTFSMFLVIVDTMGGTVDIYFNGLDVKGTYTFAMLNKVGAKGRDNFNLQEVMNAFSKGTAPAIAKF